MSEPQIIKARAAKAAGLKRYFTGKPCPKGHISERMVSSTGCIRCGRDALRDWEKRNQDKAYKWKRNWALAHPERDKALKRASYERLKNARA